VASYQTYVQYHVGDVVVLVGATVVVEPPYMDVVVVGLLVVVVGGAVVVDPGADVVVVTVGVQQVERA